MAAKINEVFQGNTVKFVVDGNLDDLEKYLGFKINGEIPPDAHIDRTKRSGGHGDWRRFFTPEDVEKLAPTMQEFIGQIGRSDWSLDPVDKLNSRTVSELVKDPEQMVKIAKERFTIYVNKDPQIAATSIKKWIRCGKTKHWCNRSFC